MAEPPSLDRPDRSLPFDPFTVGGGRRVGLTRAEMRAKALVMPHHGVRMLRERRDDVAALCESAGLLLDDITCFSHVTALRLLGVEVPRSLESDQRVHVVAQSRASRPQRRTIVAHHTTRPHLDTTVVHGLPVTTPAQTWQHLARDLGPTELIVLGDAMTRRRRPATTVGALERAVATAGKVKGVVRAREALPLVRARTDSSMETRLRLVIVRGGLPCPLVNEPVYDTGGTFLAMPDLSYPELRIAIEYLGDVHRTDAPTWRRDIRRERELRNRGWIVLEYVADDVYRFPEHIVAEVRRNRAERLHAAG